MRCQNVCQPPVVTFGSCCPPSAGPGVRPAVSRTRARTLTVLREHRFLAAVGNKMCTGAALQNKQNWHLQAFREPSIRARPK